MKLETKNSNYCATIVKIHNLISLENCDNVVGFPIFGYQAIVGKDTKIGQLGVLFTAETQLNENYCKENNLFRKKELNKNLEKVGYFEENRRVKALKFRGHKSSALFMPIESLSYLNIDTNEFKEGDTFDTINGVEICKKYVIREYINNRQNKVKGQSKVFKRVEAKLFPEHLDSENFFRNAHKYKDNDYIYVTQKLHGTSGRFGNILVKKQLKWWEKVFKKFGVNIIETEYDYVAGSRRVIKDPKAEINYNHYYNSDIWNQWLEKVKHLIPKDYIFYGEIIGWTEDNSPIQKNYTYNIEQGKSELYIYRIVKINQDGLSCDLSWLQVKEMCKNLGLKYCPDMWEGYYNEFTEQRFLDSILDEKFYELGYTECVKCDDNSPVDEGVCIRVEGIQPYITKAKSAVFLEHETKQLDKGEVDLESLQTEENA